MLAIVHGASTHTGRVRALNEDSMLSEPGMFAVADGMGGHAAGEVASALAVGRLRTLVGRPDLRPEDVLSAIEAANADIVGVALSNREQLGMGTTLAGLSLVRFGGLDHWMVFNIGDSRVYRFANGQMQQLSIDHSEVEEMIEAGEIRREDAATYPRRNVITRSLGTRPSPNPDVWVFPATPGERYLICSDGLSLEVSEEQIADVLRTEKQPQAAADRLVQGAVDAGGRDNVTVVVVDVASADSGAANADTGPRPAPETRRIDVRELGSA